MPGERSSGEPGWRLAGDDEERPENHRNKTRCEVPSAQSMPVDEKCRNRYTVSLNFDPKRSENYNLGKRSLKVEKHADAWKEENCAWNKWLEIENTASKTSSRVPLTPPYEYMWEDENYVNVKRKEKCVRSKEVKYKLSYPLVELHTAFGWVTRVTWLGFFWYATSIEDTKSRPQWLVT